MRKVAAACFADRLECAVAWAERSSIFVKLDWGRSVVLVSWIVSREIGKDPSLYRPHPRHPIGGTDFLRKRTVQ